MFWTISIPCSTEKTTTFGDNSLQVSKPGRKLILHPINPKCITTCICVSVCVRVCVCVSPRKNQPLRKRHWEKNPEGLNRSAHFPAKKSK